MTLTEELDRLRNLETAMIGLLADIRDHWEGNERDLDVIAEDIEAEFGLQEQVQAARTGATVEPVQP